MLYKVVKKYKIKEIKIKYNFSSLNTQLKQLYDIIMRSWGLRSRSLIAIFKYGKKIQHISLNILVIDGLFFF